MGKLAAGILVESVFRCRTYKYNHQPPYIEEAQYIFIGTRKTRKADGIAGDRSNFAEFNV